MPETRKILLWGATKVGKTALLATALHHDPDRLPGIDWVASAGEISATLNDVWRRLKSNRYVKPTAYEAISTRLVTRGGTILEITDIKGGLSENLGQAGVQERLREADAVLFLAEYRSEQSPSQMAAISGALAFAREKKRALVFTKCERALTFDDPIWNRPENWLSRTPHWAEHRQMLNSFGPAVWPTSAYGYEPSYRLPAVILSETGQALPFRIQPRNVSEPFAWIRRELDCP